MIAPNTTLFHLDLLRLFNILFSGNHPLLFLGKNSGRFHIFPAYIFGAGFPWSLLVIDMVLI